MSRIKELRSELLNHDVLTRNLPKLSENDFSIREFLRRKLLLQIECEEFRNSIRVSFLHVALVPRIHTDGNLEVHTMKSINNWEPLCKKMTEQVDEKEIKGITYYDGRIQELYESSKSISNDQ